MDQEVRGQTAVAGFGFGKSDCGRGRIDAGRFQSHAGCHESMLAGPATHVQDPASNSARFRQRQKGRLRAADIPRGCAGVEGVKIFWLPRPHPTRQLFGWGDRRLILFRGFHDRAPHVSIIPFWKISLSHCPTPEHRPIFLNCRDRQLREDSEAIRATAHELQTPECPRPEPPHWAGRSYGSVNANRESPSGPASRIPCPPAEITRYCLPFGPRNVMGVARALVGSAPFQSSSPLVTSKARSAGSSVPAIKIRPPAVTMGPPREKDPRPGGAPGIWPIGTVHFTSAISASIALSVPQEGGLQGEPPGLRRNRRAIP